MTSSPPASPANSLPTYTLKPKKRAFEIPGTPNEVIRAFSSADLEVAHIFVNRAGKGGRYNFRVTVAATTVAGGWRVPVVVHSYVKVVRGGLKSSPYGHAYIPGHKDWDTLHDHHDLVFELLKRHSDRSLPSTMMALPQHGSPAAREDRKLVVFGDKKKETASRTPLIVGPGAKSVPPSVDRDDASSRLALMLERAFGHAASP